MHPLTSIETQLLSRTRPYSADTWGPHAGRWLHLNETNPQVEVQGAESLVEKALLEVTHTQHGDTWYELTTQGLAYFQATWPNRKDRP